MISWDERLFGTTRSRIVTELRRGQRTVDDLACAAGVSDNAVRAHLAALERDRFVQPSGARPSGGKPAVLYELTLDAQEFFPRAYSPVLNRLIDVLEERQPMEETLDLLRAVGRRLAHCLPAAHGNRRRRLEYAAQLMSGMGALTEVERTPEGGLRLYGFSCPIGSVIRKHPEACSLAESFVRELTGLPMRECCQRTECGVPRCAFELEQPE